MTGDEIGTRGEAILFLLLTQLCEGGSPYFRPRFLGEKSEALDYLVELLNPGTQTPFFFVQVKTTTLGYAGAGRTRRLKARVKQSDVRRLLSYPAPTYVVGIDERWKTGYLLSLGTGPAKAVSGVSTRFPLNCENLKRLWEEVREFWRGRGTMTTSAFRAD